MTVSGPGSAEGTGKVKRSGTEAETAAGTETGIVIAAAGTTALTVMTGTAGSAFSEQWLCHSIEV